MIEAASVNPMMGGGMSAAEQAKMIADVVAQTQSSVLTETMGQLMHRQEESQRFQATLMAEAFQNRRRKLLWLCQMRKRRSVMKR